MTWLPPRAVFGVELPHSAVMTPRVVCGRSAPSPFAPPTLREDPPLLVRSSPPVTSVTALVSVSTEGVPRGRAGREGSENGNSYGIWGWGSGTPRRRYVVRHTALVGAHDDNRPPADSPLLHPGRNVSWVPAECEAGVLLCTPPWQLLGPPLSGLWSAVGTVPPLEPKVGSLDSLVTDDKDSGRYPP